MNTKLTLDFGNEQLVKMLKVQAMRSGTSMKNVIVKALEAYFTNEVEYQALLRGAEQTFAEWKHPADAAYDKL